MVDLKSWDGQSHLQREEVFQLRLIGNEVLLAKWGAAPADGGRLAVRVQEGDNMKTSFVRYIGCCSILLSITVGCEECNPSIIWRRDVAPIQKRIPALLSCTNMLWHGEIITKDSSIFLKMLDKDIKEKKVEKLDRPFKLNFYPNSSLVKISTIHSFKGFEIPYLVLVISPIYKDGKVYTDLPINTIFELLYAGLSRGIKNLTIVNAAEVKEIDSFFQENSRLFN